MNKRVLLGVGGGLLLVLGLVVGVIAGPSLQALAAGGQASAAAATPTAGNYCQLYEQTVSSKLGVSQSQLESANKDALQAVINKMYADGKMTAAQKAQAEQELKQYATNPCAALQAAAQARQAQGSGAGASSSQTQLIGGARTALLTAVAGAMNISASALQSELSSGKTVAQVITEKGASKSAVDTAYLKSAQSQLSAAVSKGALSQSQSSMAYSFIQQSVASGDYPLLDKGSAFGGMLPASMMSGQ